MSIARTGRGLAAALAASALVVAPTPGAVTSSTVTARVKLVHFRLSAKDVGKKPKRGEGHLHFAMDNGKFDHPKYSGANGKLAVQLGVAGMYSPSVTPTITYK